MSIQTATGEPAVIVALHPNIQPVHYSLESEICLIGRADMCQIIIPDQTISRIQAVIEREKSGYYVLRDANSANGTYVNGQQIIDLYRLSDQDEIGVGTPTAVLRFKAAIQTIPSD